MKRTRRRLRVRGLPIAMLACFVVAFVVRLLWVLKIQSPHAAVYSDMAGYFTRADELLGTGAPSLDPRTNAFYPFGTHYLVAGELALFGRKSEIGVAIVHAFVGGLAAPCVVYLTSRLVRARPTMVFATITGLVAALWQPQITYVGFFMSEIWFTAALLIAGCLFVRQAESRSSLAALGAGVAASAAFVIRPQVILTLAIVAVFTLALRRKERPSLSKLTLLAAPILLTLAFSSYRLHSLSGTWGLISENGPLMRVFGETEVGRVESRWVTPTGVQYGAWYAAGLRKPFTEANTVRYNGYQGDAAILNGIREERLKGVPVSARVRRASENVKALVLQNFPNPEADFHGDITRLKLSRVFRKILYWVLGFAVIGLFAIVRPKTTSTAAGFAAGVIVVANLLTVVALPLTFYTEARYRVPYDPFILVAAAVGAGLVFDSVVLRFGQWARDRFELKS